MKRSIHKINKPLGKDKKKSPSKDKKGVGKKTAKKIDLHKSKPIKAKVRTKTLTKTKTKTKTKGKTATKGAILQHKPRELTKKPMPEKRSLPAAQNIVGPVNIKPYQPGKNEEYMSNKQLEHFQTVLLQWKSQLMAEVDRTMHHMQDEVANYPDPVDRASQEEEFSLELRARDRERKLLRKIEEALSRIKDNDYGYCDDCGAEIGVRRLEARPTATQCIECKTIAEMREKQVGESS